MKRTMLALLFIFSLLLAGFASAEGDAPAAVEKEAPVSMGDYLHRYPDQEITGEDGSVTEVYTGISPESHDGFLEYLKNQKQKLSCALFGATLDFEYLNESGGNLFPDAGHYELEGQTPIHCVVLRFSATGAVIHFRYDTAAKEARVIYPRGTYDRRTRNAREQYDRMTALAEEGKMNEAVQAYRQIDDPALYGPAAEYAASHPDLAAAISRFRFEVPGEIVSFGRYEQDGNPANGPEPIEWLVLDVLDGKSLLVSRYALDIVPYHTEYADVTWETASIRAWLNGDFLSSALDESERTAVLTAEVDNSAAQGKGGSAAGGGNNTLDSVFLLSYAEAWNYFGTDELRLCSLTAYAAARAKALPDGPAVTGPYTWWLRSPGSLPSCAMRVAGDGSDRSAFVDYNEPAVRPAVWIDLTSDFF